MASEIPEPFVDRLGAACAGLAERMSAPSSGRMVMLVNRFNL